MRRRFPTPSWPLLVLASGGAASASNAIGVTPAARPGRREQRLARCRGERACINTRMSDAFNWGHGRRLVSGGLNEGLTDPPAAHRPTT